MKRAQNVPDSAAVGLSLFAAAWFERWQGGRGSVMLEGDGRAVFGWVPYKNERFARPMPGEIPTDLIERQTEFDTTQHHGRMRELLDLLEAVPGGLDAVKAYVKAWAL